MLDRVYVPAFPVAYRYKDYFKPTPLTDSAGNLVEHLADELLGKKNPRPPESEARASAT